MLHQTLAVPRPSPKYTSSYKGSVLLSTRSLIDCLDVGLYSAKGAQEVISMITSRPKVTKLVLSHNKLGDEGCEVLFKFLCSDVGKKKNIAEIKLAMNGIGDRGLLAISEYLRRNDTLKELHLQSNSFTGTPLVASCFTAALNSSQLENLNLGSNTQLSDTFCCILMHELDTPHLRNLSLSIVGITALSVPNIISYISSPRCHLDELSLNGNSLGSRGVINIIAAADKDNFTLGVLQLYSNHHDEPIWLDAREKHEVVLQRLLRRNLFLKGETEKEALSLLVSARAALLRPKCQKNAITRSPPTSSPPSQSDLSLPSLPTELHLLILSFLAPSLSSAQRIRIYNYASTPNTLPPLLPRLTSTGSSWNCLPDPSRMGPFTGGPMMARSGCLDGCMKGIVCQREVERAKWLKLVRCDAYEREDQTSLKDSRT